MSPQALQVAITALEGEVATARSWVAMADENLRKAHENLTAAVEGRDTAERALAHAEEALEALQGLQPPAEDDDELEDVPAGAEAAGGGVRVWQDPEDGSFGAEVAR